MTKGAATFLVLSVGSIAYFILYKIGVSSELVKFLFVVALVSALYGMNLLNVKGRPQETAFIIGKLEVNASMFALFLIFLVTILLRSFTASPEVITMLIFPVCFLIYLLVSSISKVKTK